MTQQQKQAIGIWGQQHPPINSVIWTTEMVIEFSNYYKNNVADYPIGYIPQIMSEWLGRNIHLIKKK